jgi:hypothetical protein
MRLGDCLAATTHTTGSHPFNHLPQIFFGFTKFLLKPA